MSEKKETPAQIMAAARANITKRDTCQRHKFNPDEYAFAKPMTCLHCGCKVPTHYIHPYVQGYVAAGGNADDIWEGWEGSPQKRAATGG